MGYRRTLSVEVLSNRWAKLSRHVIEYARRDGSVETQIREVQEHGDGAAVLPYDASRGTVLLVRQFRLAAFLNGHPEPLIEVCAGLLDGQSPEACAAREAEEELGTRVRFLRRVADVFSSPGSLTERVTLFEAEYDASCKVGPGGGQAGEGEDIEILEIAFDDAMKMVDQCEIADAKTLILLQHLRLELMRGD